MRVDLEAGILLEGRGVRLPWGATLNEVRLVAPPDIWTVSKESPPKYRLAWNDRVWGGLGCQIGAAFDGPHQPQAVLLGVRLAFNYPEGVRLAPDGFRWLQAELAKRFGPPASFRDDGEEQGEAVWWLGGVTVRHDYFDGFGGGNYVFAFRRTAQAEPSAAADRGGVRPS